jgi:hypothetical protein
VLQSITAGAGPLVFDGLNLWVSSGTSLLKVSLATGQTVATVNIPDGAGGLAFDGYYVWVVMGGFGNSGPSRVIAGTATSDLHVNLSAGGPIESIVSDGQNIWVAQGFGTLNKIDPSDGSIVGTFSAGILPLGMTFDGTSIWHRRQCWRLKQDQGQRRHPGRSLYPQ